MEHKEAADILINLSSKSMLNEQEKEAVNIAIGVLAWTSLAKSRMKNLKAKKNRQDQSK